MISIKSFSFLVSFLIFFVLTGLFFLIMKYKSSSLSSQSIENLTSLWTISLALLLFAQTSKYANLLNQIIPLTILISLFSLFFLFIHFNARSLLQVVLIGLVVIKFTNAFEAALLVLTISLLIIIYLFCTIVKKQFDFKRYKFLTLLFLLVGSILLLEKHEGLLIVSYNFNPESLFLIMPIFALVIFFMYHFAKNYQPFNVILFLSLTYGIVLCVLWVFWGSQVSLSFLIISAVYQSWLANKVLSFNKFTELRISILMPAYNDESTIRETLESIEKQSYRNYEVIIVNDGSNDNTYRIAKLFKKEHSELEIKLLSQKNSDQLVALKNATNYMTGDLVYILHSDDCFVDNKVLEKANLCMQDPELDGTTHDVLVQDEQSKVTGVQHFIDYYWQDTMAAKVALYLGRNLFADFSFFRSNIFEKYVSANYLKNNTPPWLELTHSLKPLHLFKADFYVISYRVGPANYINNPIGRLNVLNGELRTLTMILSQLDIPFYQMQNLLYRIAKKCRLDSLYFPLFIHGKTKKENMGKIILNTVIKREPAYHENDYLNALVNFYCTPSERRINLEIPSDLLIYQGANMRSFNKALLNNELPDFYNNLFEEMQQGFSEIGISKEQLENLKEILIFLNIEPFVDIHII